MLILDFITFASPCPSELGWVLGPPLSLVLIIVVRQQKEVGEARRGTVCEW